MKSNNSTPDLLIIHRQTLTKSTRTYAHSLDVQDYNTTYKNKARKYQVIIFVRQDMIKHVSKSPIQLKGPAKSWNTFASTMVAKSWSTIVAHFANPFRCNKSSDRSNTLRPRHPHSYCHLYTHLNPYAQHSTHGCHYRSWLRRSPPGHGFAASHWSTE